MDDDFLDELRKPGSPQAQHALLVAALLHLMSHYTMNSAVNSAVNSAAGTQRREGPCVKLASVIERHLNALARLPDADPVLKATCEQLSAKWANVVDSAMPVPPKRPLLARILRPAPRKTGAPAFAV
jgi:hypothetical protein